MDNNIWPVEYFHNPNSNKPIEQIWADIDGYTFEGMYENESMSEKIDFVIPFPPLKMKGKTVKGMFFSQGTDTIMEKFPKLKEIFFPIANSMFSSYPRSKHARYYFTCYYNPRREAYFKNTHQDKKDIIMLPLQDADFTNENIIAPTFNTPKTLDIFCVSTVYPVKNVPMIAKALLEYEKKYGRILKVKYAIGSSLLKINEDKTLDYSRLRSDAQHQLKQIEAILGDVRKYIEFVPTISYEQLPKYYTSAKCCVLASLLEGKNRFISEAMACDTPVVVFKDFNKYSRGDYPIFFENSGEYAVEFTPEALCDAIRKVILNPGRYEPRKNYLKYSGRKNFLNLCIDSNPYYKFNLPDYQKGRILDNIWVNEAMQKNYQLSTYDFLYGRNPAIQKIKGMKNITSIIEFFYSRFGIKK